MRRVWLAIDRYLYVNPLNVEAQMVGGVVHAINATLYGRQTFVNGAAQRKNFNTNPMIRLQQMPQVMVTLMPRPAVADRTVPIGGIGRTRRADLRAGARQRAVQAHRPAGAATAAVPERDDGWLTPEPGSPAPARRRSVSRRVGPVAPATLSP